MKKLLTWQLVVTIVLALILGFFDLPDAWQSKIFPWTPNTIKEAKIRLGLDLQGGSQLDYKIDLRKVPEKDRKAITDGVFTVINNRVNSLGVSEPNIYLSTVGDEEHIVVELAAIKDLEEAKKTVGKTIQLEFKEKKDAPDAGEKEKQEGYAKDILKKVMEKKDGFAVIGQEEEKANPGKVRYAKEDNSVFASDLPGDLKTIVSKLKPGAISQTLGNVTDEYMVDSSGQLQKNSGLYIVKLLEKNQAVKNKKEVSVEHILISYKDAAEKNGLQGVTRSEDEAKKLAADLKSQAKSQEEFEKLAKQYSDDAGSKNDGGKLKDPVTTEASYVQEFKDGALKLTKAGEMTDPVKSQFGYHIIRALDVKSDQKEDQVKLEKIFISTTPDQWKETGLTGEQFEHADVGFDQYGQSYVSIRFNEKGAKLFEDLTARNVNKPIAIFVGGSLISAPNVKEKITGGNAQITGNFTIDDSNNLARDLNTGAIPAPITLAGQHTIGSTLGQDALAKSIKAGVIGLLFLAVLMMLYYRLPGILAVIALSIYTTILLFIIKSSLPIAASLLIALLVFGALIHKILNSKDPGWEKLLSFGLSVVVLIFLTSLLHSPITLTLAGVAGVILSIGMAVDANILIFERIREELGEGHTLSASIEHGFDRAWNSIRDSNFSSLITCAILFYFGSSLIRGFALNLAAGILISMFSAITLTRTFLRIASMTKWGQNPALYGIKKQRTPWRIIEKSKLMFVFSGTLILASLIGAGLFSVRLGLDFTGGTLMELKFDKNVTVEDIRTALPSIEENLNKMVKTGVTAPTSAAPSTSVVSTQQSIVSAGPFVANLSEKVDLEAAQIIETNENETKTFNIKTKFLGNEAHDAFLAQMKVKFGNTEELKFENVGPTIGDALKQKALVAIVLASIMIIMYLAFAFRKVPKELSSWKFGVSAVIALLHDLIITFGLFVFLGKFLHVEIDALFITAMLTVLGFSVHDTIVVFDRLREHLNRGERGSIVEITNRALTETMARSINTSLSTIITLTALLIFGAPSIFFFILALVVGIIIGTYSSVGVATAILIAWYQWEKKGNQI